MLGVIFIVVGLVLIAVGLLFALRGVGGEGEAGGSFREILKFEGPPWLVLVVIGVVVAALGAFEPWEDDPNTVTLPTTIPQLPTTQPPPAPTTTGSTPLLTFPTVVPTDTAIAPTTAFLADDCIVEVTPIAVLHEEPATFSQEIMRVPHQGTSYVVEDVATEDRVVSEKRWLQITVDNRTGWIEDSTFTIASKSAGCP